MLSSPARLAANRANAAHSTGPRTAEGKAASSRNALSHGAYATDDTLLAACVTPDPGAKQTHVATSSELQPAPAYPTAENDGPALLASFTAHYAPAGPAETLLVRRIVAATLRIDLLERALDALMELGERRALIDHLADTFAINEPKMQVRDAPNYASMLRRYDGTAEPPPGYDVTLDPDPTLCGIAYTLSSPRAALLMRHEATAERRLHASMRELHRLQADRRAQQKERNEPTTRRSKVARKDNPDRHAALVGKEATRHAAMELRDEFGNDPTSHHGMVPSGAARNGLITHSPAMARNKATIAHPVQVHITPDAVPHGPSTLLPKHPTAVIKNEPTTPPAPVSGPPIDATRNRRSEPIPAASLLSPMPVTSGNGRLLPARQRRMSPPDPLERLIRRAERSAGSIY